MKKTLLINTFAVTLYLGSTDTSSAAIIDFETVPLGSPSDQLAIGTQYKADFGITFGLDTTGDNMIDGGTPFLEKIGGIDSGHSFLNNQEFDRDIAAPGYEDGLGEYFLRLGIEGLQTAPVPALIVKYDAPVSAMSAEIWDIDGFTNTESAIFGTERWLVSALDSSLGVIDSVESPIGVDIDSTSLDGLPWYWSFDRHGINDIYAIRIEFTGTKTAGLGLAFDRFSPDSIASATTSASAVPVPAAIWLFGSGLIGLIGIARRKA